ncbi:UNVERIFIED_CONTAM: hypothetical protein GTU68_062355 [Idotea baltica]|nr:hypothetical protein [Idotea baltica]
MGSALRWHAERLRSARRVIVTAQC